MMRHSLNPVILREYDIRGVAGDTLTATDAHAIGCAFGAIVKKNNGNKVAVGRDGRVSSPMLADSLITGLMAAGMEVMDIGMGPTPMLYFADRHLDSDGAIEVTGSHNPASHNGFKMVLGHKPFFGADITALGDMLAGDGVSDTRKGARTAMDISGDWLTAMQKATGRLDGFNESIIWDCGNGATGPITERLTAMLPGKHKVLFAEPDGTFPNHHPDPTDPATLALLGDAMQKANATLGIGFDGDGDRIGLLDHKGRAIAGDIITAYLAVPLLQKHPEILFDIKTSIAVLDRITGLGGKPILGKTGHSNMKLRMAEGDIKLGGEMSGHIFIRDGYFGFDDALFAAMRVLARWHETGESIGDFMDSLPATFPTAEMRTPCKDEEKFAIMKNIISDSQNDNGEVLTIDGIRVTTTDGWWLLRASNTGGYLVARAEGRSAAARDTLIQTIAGHLAKAGLDMPA